VVARDGSNPRMIHAFDRGLEDWEGRGWSPDGRRIAVCYAAGAGQVCLLIGTDGSGPVGRLERGCPDQWYGGFWPPLDGSGL